MVHRFQRLLRRYQRPLTIVGVVLATILVISAGYAAFLNSKFGDIIQFQPKGIEARPDEGHALTVLVLGADKGQSVPGIKAKSRLSTAVRAKHWPKGRYRSDTIMMVHVTANRRHVYLVSIPRDTYTKIFDAAGREHPKSKINDAFAEYGPGGTIATLEHRTKIQISHLAIINFNGFKDITRAVGGVEVYIPRSFYDPSQKVYWKAGKQNLEGPIALKYVRTRYGLPRSDFDRIARQQNFMRALMKKLLDKGTTRNPVRLNRTLSALTRNMVIDSQWSRAEIRALVLSMRNTEAKDVTFLTAPVARTEDVDGVGNVVKLDNPQARRLFRAMATDRMGDYVKDHPDEVLKSSDEIS